MERTYFLITPPKKKEGGYEVNMAALPVVTDFAAGFAAAVRQLNTAGALRLPTGWVASPSLRWIPRGVTLLVRWGTAPNRSPGGGRKER